MNVLAVVVCGVSDRIQRGLQPRAQTGVPPEMPSPPEPVLSQEQWPLLAQPAIERRQPIRVRDRGKGLGRSEMAGDAWREQLESVRILATTRSRTKKIRLWRRNFLRDQSDSFGKLRFPDETDSDSASGDEDGGLEMASRSDESSESSDDGDDDDDDDVDDDDDDAP